MIDEAKLSQIETLLHLYPDGTHVVYAEEHDHSGEAWTLHASVLKDLVRLARLGLWAEETRMSDYKAMIENLQGIIESIRPVAEWAEKHGVPALKKAAEQVTWCDEKNQKVLLTYGFHIESCQKAMAALPTKGEG